jgi:hypothetical protein
MAAIFLAAERNEWDSLTLLEHRTDRERTRRVFEEANVRYKASIQSRQHSRRIDPINRVASAWIINLQDSAQMRDEGHIAFAQSSLILQTTGRRLQCAKHSP